MTTYIYPQNLKATANLWLWSLRDFTISCIALLLSVLIFSQTQLILPIVLTLLYAFLTIRFDDATVMDFMIYAVKYFISTQQLYYWREKR